VPDLLSLSQVQAALAQALPADQSVLPTVVSAASRACQRYCRRWFVAQSLLEIRVPQQNQWDKGEPDVIQLQQFPLTAPPRLRGGRTNALQVTNPDTVTNQQAWLEITTTGDPDISLTNTGLILHRVASGVQTNNTLTWASYPTVAALAAAINALGGGWQATVESPYGPWPSADLYGSEGTAGALSTAHAKLDVFSTDISNARVDVASGCVYLPAGDAGQGGGPGNVWQWPGSSDVMMGANAWRGEVLCAYTAGYATVPEDVQEACYVTVKSMLYELQTVTKFQQETGDKFSYVLANLDERGLPAVARRLLAPWRIQRV
jgi:hypothetical protein